jgi:hypothetical protein
MGRPGGMQSSNASLNDSSYMPYKSRPNMPRSTQEVLQLAKRSQAIRQRVNHEIEQADVNEADKDKKEKSFAELIADGTYT